MKSIYAHSSDSISIYANTFQSVDKKNCILYVPYFHSNLYKDGDVWKDFANIEIFECGLCGVDAYWSFIDGVLTISGSGPTAEEGNNWYIKRDYIQCVEIERGITSIVEDAFKNYNRVKSVIIPNTVTEIIRGCS